MLKTFMAFALAVPLAGIAAQSAAARAARPDATARCGTVPTERSRVSKDSSLTGVAATSWCDVWAVGSNFNGRRNLTLIEHWNGAKWKQVPSPSPYHSNGFNGLNGVAATSFRNAWAVGWGEGKSSWRTLIEHWNGSAWRRIPSPTPGRAAMLNAVAADTSTDAWAAGVYQNTSGQVTLIEHWNGKSWTHVPSPSPSGFGAYLTGVAATSASNAWAVGYSYPPGVSPRPRVKTLIERWNGTSWSVVPSPNPAGRKGGDNRLFAVSAVSSSNAWAVGYSREPGAKARPLIEHWDGTAWTRVPGAGPAQKFRTLLGVSALSARNAWAVGTYAPSNKEFGVGTGNRTLILHWNGTSWHRVGSPNQPGRLGSNELTAVAAVSGTNAWAIGNHAGFGALTEPTAEHWRAGAWHLVATPMLH